jgi:heat shock protein HslJ
LLLVFKDYTIYKGCGRYLADYRLHDIWVLDSINNKKISAEDFMKGNPLLELNLTENKIYGNTGCNNISGAIEVLGKKIHFGRLATTRIACKDMDFESSLFKRIG